MTRRIVMAIMGVASFVLLALGIPLAIAIRKSYVSAETASVHEKMTRTLGEITLPIDVHQLGQLTTETDPPPPFGVYLVTGAKLFGDGPSTSDAVVKTAQHGSTSSTASGAIVVAAPIADRNENVVGLIRISRPMTGVDDRTRRALLIMAGAAALAIGAAWMIARSLATRLAAPVAQLASTAAAIRHGQIVASMPPSGIDELDSVADTLVASSRHISEALARERRFSADVSHQLRTPLAGLRLHLESHFGNADSVNAQTVLADLSRLEQTVEHLLELARDAVPSGSACDVASVVDGVVARWQERASATGRAVVFVGGLPCRAAISSSSLEHVLDVLIDNAFVHGQGAIGISIRKVAGGVTVDVVDQGEIPESQREVIFARGHGRNHGIGLAFARSLAEAEGCRLLLTKLAPTTLSIAALVADRSRE